MLLTRRRFLAGLGGTAAASAASLGYLRWAEPQWLEVSRTAVPLAPSGRRSGLRVLHLSDFHVSPVVPVELIAEAIELGLAARPDLIALTGDFITNRVFEATRFTALLARLARAAPAFACLGNHDGGPWTQRAGGNATVDEMAEMLRAANITWLHNRAETLRVRERLVQLAGVGDLWSGMCDPAAAFAMTSPRRETTRLVLNHNPDAKDRLRPFDWDLMLCGHTHGGQLRLPLIGTPFAPVADKRYVEGLHRWENRWLYITRGVGNLHGMRFNCRPEVSVLDIA